MGSRCKNVCVAARYAGLDRTIKEFLSTCPLINSLRQPAMRDRHWEELMDVTKKEFSVPSKDANFRLRDLLDLNLHQFSEQVEEITDKATREAKHEETLKTLESTWATIVFGMTLYKNTDVPILKLTEEDNELLEADQLALQGMVSSRYVHFKPQSLEWQGWLGAVSDVTQCLAEIQRTWSYLEPLFIGSDEVKRELPEDAERFATIDKQVREILKTAWATKKVKEACNSPGLLPRLEAMQEQQEVCKKSLSDFLDGKRRLFPRFYFTSEADLLDILSNGSQPARVMKHIDKVLLATAKLTLDESPGVRPKASAFIAGVGEETVDFNIPVPLEGKVENYLQVCVFFLLFFRSFVRSFVRPSVRSFVLSFFLSFFLFLSSVDFALCAGCFSSSQPCSCVPEPPCPPSQGRHAAHGHLGPPPKTWNSRCDLSLSRARRRRCSQTSSSRSTRRSSARARATRRSRVSSG